MVNYLIPTHHSKPTTHHYERCACNSSLYLRWYSASVLLRRSLVSTLSYGIFKISSHLVISPPDNELTVFMYLNFSNDCMPAFLSRTDGAAASRVFSVSISLDSS
jgi:hypothetical protein